MPKADTPAPEKKEEKKVTTPPGPDTPAVEKGETTPPTPQEQKVTELEAEVNRLGIKLTEQENLLVKQETIAKNSQRDKAVAERKERELQTTIEGIKSGEIDISEINLPAETLPSEEDAIKDKILIGVQNLLLGNPDFQNLINQDITLREVLKKNPSVLIGEFFSVEDAVEQVREKLDEKVSSLKKVQPKEEKKEGEEGPEFEAGPTQPKEGPPSPPPEPTPQTSDEKIEESIKSKIKVGE